MYSMTSYPSAPGSMMSRRTRSKDSFSIRSIAFRPSCTVVQWYPAEDRFKSIKSQIGFSSSTINTLIIFCFPPPVSSRSLHYDLHGIFLAARIPLLDLRICGKSAGSLIIYAVITFDSQLVLLILVAVLCQHDDILEPVPVNIAAVNPLECVQVIILSHRHQYWHNIILLIDKID